MGVKFFFVIRVSVSGQRYLFRCLVFFSPFPRNIDVSHTFMLHAEAQLERSNCLGFCRPCFLRRRCLVQDGFQQVCGVSVTVCFRLTVIITNETDNFLFERKKETVMYSIHLIENNNLPQGFCIEMNSFGI